MQIACAAPEVMASLRYCDAGQVPTTRLQSRTALSLLNNRAAFHQSGRVRDRAAGAGHQGQQMRTCHSIARQALSPIRHIHGPEPQYLNGWLRKRALSLLAAHAMLHGCISRHCRQHRSFLLHSTSAEFHPEYLGWQAFDAPGTRATLHRYKTLHRRVRDVQAQASLRADRPDHPDRQIPRCRTWRQMSLILIVSRTLYERRPLDSK